ncbi:MAG: BlaI/MecI/CopY family transcriptional regulator [Bacteroidales bacterium]
MENNKKHSPTESELEILQILWEKGSATVRQVHEVLEQVKNTGYTTTLKTMQVMTDKGLLKRNTESRIHIYTPLLTLEKTQNTFLEKMMRGLFKGNAKRLVMGALNHKEISQEELQDIKAYLENFETRKS